MFNTLRLASTWLVERSGLNTAFPAVSATCLAAILKACTKGSREAFSYWFQSSKVTPERGGAHGTPCN